MSNDDQVQIGKLDASDEISRILGMINTKDDQSTTPAQAVQPVDKSTPQGPIEVEVSDVSTHNQTETTHKAVDWPSIPEELASSIYQPEEEETYSPSKAAIKKVSGIAFAVLPYILIFAVGVGIYYFFFADSSIKWHLPFTQKTTQTPEQVAAETIAKNLKSAQSDQKGEYEAWIKQFFFTVTDQTRLEMDTVTPNGFTNFENFLLGLNPKTRDANANGKIDALDVLAGQNPETGKELSDSQKDAIAKYFNTKEILKRLNQSSSRQVPAKGVSIRTFFNKEALASEGGRVAGASTNSPSANQSITAASGKYKINLNTPGRLEIPSIEVNVPIIWTNNPADFDEDLKKGVVHHPDTPLPGDIGTAYIAGHSTNYQWIKADFNKVFARINELNPGATFKITVVNAEGKNIKMYYSVDKTQIFEANDQAQFVNFADSRVALSTCWPIGSLKQRMVTYAKLTKVEEM